MKTWQDVKKGDYIYYYDHCKYHKQLVHDIKEETQTESFTDWFGKKQERTYNRYIIYAGRSNFIIQDYFKTNNWCWANGMKRFASIEAVNEDENNKKSKLMRRYERAKRKYEKIKNILIKHNYLT